MRREAYGFPRCRGGGGTGRDKEGERSNQERKERDHERLVGRDFVGRGYCDLVIIARSTGDSYGKPNLLPHDTDPKKDAAFIFCELINSEK